MSEGTPPPPPENPYGGGEGQGQPPNQPPPGQQPPPPPGGYGQPGYGAPGGYGGPPPPPGTGFGGPNAYSPPDAIGFGWNAFKVNPAPLLLGTLLLLVVAGGISIITNIIASSVFVTQPTTTVNPDGTISLENGSGFLAGLLVSVLVSLIVGVLAQLMVAALIKGALDTVDGKPVTFASMFEGWDKGKVLVAAILVSVATAIGTLLCYLPGLVIGFLTSYTMFFVVDRNLSPIEAIKASVKFVTDNLGQTILYYLLAALVVFAGVLLCFVGLLAALPIAILGAAYTFRRLQGQSAVPTR